MSPDPKCSLLLIQDIRLLHF